MTPNFNFCLRLLPELQTCISNCIINMSSWIPVRQSQLHVSKTELLIFSRVFLIFVNGTSVYPVAWVDTGVMRDSALSLSSHIQPSECSQFCPVSQLRLLISATCVSLPLPPSVARLSRVGFSTCALVCLWSLFFLVTRRVLFVCPVTSLLSCKLSQWLLLAHGVNNT